MQAETDILKAYLRKKGLKWSSRREKVLRAFLAAEHHVTVDSLYDKIRRRDAGIGHTTVYRNLHLLAECGLARVLKLNDGLTRFEHNYGHDHHDHLVCMQCGRLIEVVDQDIEQMQKRLAKKHGFTMEWHRMEIYGRCKKCAG